MDLNIYTGDDNFYLRGSITIERGLITHMHGNTPGNFLAVMPLIRNTKIRDYIQCSKAFMTWGQYENRVEYKFSLRKLSKRERAYKIGKMTHQLLSSEMQNHIGSQDIFIKLR
jgi:hypothetical protein